MNWNDFEEVWKRQHLPVGVYDDVRELKKTFEAKRRKTAAFHFARDILTTGVGLLAAAGMGLAWYGIGWSGWPIALCMIWALGASAISMKERLRVHHYRLGSDVSLLVKVVAEIAELKRQRYMVLRWERRYIPLGIIPVALSVATVIRHSKGSPPWEFLPELLTNPVTLAWIIILTVAHGCFVWRGWQANRDEILKIDRRLNELEMLRQELFSQGST
jgi:hypothetical protein